LGLIDDVARRVADQGATTVVAPGFECVTHMCDAASKVNRGRIAPVTSSPSHAMSQALAKLTPAQSRALFSLSYVKAPPSPSTAELALAIFETNAVAAGPNTVGLFPHMARLNHGCARSFNSVYSWREEEGVLVVHALKPIGEGEVCCLRLVSVIDRLMP
jgi:hypothetical protein